MTRGVDGSNAFSHFKYLTTLLTGAFIAALYAFPEHFGHSPSCFLLQSKFTASCWVQDVQHRVFGTFGQPNWLASYLVTLIFIPLSFTLTPNQKSSTSNSKNGATDRGLTRQFTNFTGADGRFSLTALARLPAWLTNHITHKLQPRSSAVKKIATNQAKGSISFTDKKISTTQAVSLATYLLFFTILLFTKSRSGLLAFAAGLTLFVSLGTITTCCRQRWRQLSLLLTATIFLFFIFGRGIFPQIDARIKLHRTPPQPPPTNQGTQLDTGGTESGEIRKIVWQGAIDIWKAYPLTGSGVETFAYSYFNHRPSEHNRVSEWDFLYNKAHNEFLNLAATTGTFGLITYLLLMATYTGWSLKLIFKKGGRVEDEGSQFLQFAPTGLKTWLDSREQAKISRKQSFANKEIVATEVRTAKSTKLLLIALLAGYWALAVTNFFGFSTVPVALLFFLIPALSFSFTQAEKVNNGKANRFFPTAVAHLKMLIAGDTSRGFTLSENKGTPSINTTKQPLALIAVFCVTSYLLLTTARFFRADLVYTTGKRLSDQDHLSLALADLRQATTLRPNEPVYTDELSLTLAKTALQLAPQNATQAAQLADIAIELSDKTLALNPVHLNFYKSRTRLFVDLANFDPNHLQSARQALVTATQLAPTDPKLWLNLALIELQISSPEAAEQYFLKSLELKPDLELARYSLGLMYEQLDTPAKAIPHYQYILDHINPNHRSIQDRLTAIATLSALKK